MSTQEMKVENTAFLIEKLASDCAPLQYVRELTSNALQAIEARRNEGWLGEGEVVWDVDWALVKRDGLYKLQISDNGTGMTGREIEQYINHLSSSGRVQDRAQNFGLGAKITACVKNPAGLVYKTWKSGQGTIATLWKDPQMGYGLRQISLGDGRFAHFATLDDAAKCAPIDDCGTAVVLIGASERDSHTFIPDGAANKWLIKYLNDRYFAFPEQVSVRVRNFQRTERAGWPSRPDLSMGKTEGNEAGSQLKLIRGMQSNLDAVAESKGEVALKDASVRWWLLPEEGVDQKDIWESTGHCAALYQGELYDFLRSNTGRARLREFGIVFGTSRVVLYVEPDAKALDIYANTARSGLLSGGNPLPWSRWASEFRDRVPIEIQGMMDALVSRSGDKDHRDAIRRRLKEMGDLLRPSRYRPTPGGPVTAGGTVIGGAAGSGAPRGEGSAPSGTSGGSQGNFYTSFIKSGGAEAQPVPAQSEIPEIRWISLAEGTREAGDLEDRAARMIREKNLLQINADFRVFQDLIKYCLADYNPSGDDNIGVEIRDVVREWIGLQLVEAVVSILAIDGSKEWGSDVVAMALSEEALTAAAMPRYVMLQTIRRALGARFGGKRATAEDA